MNYKDATKLKKADMADLSPVEIAELRMYAGIEVDSILSRLGSSSDDFKQVVALELYRRVVYK